VIVAVNKAEKPAKPAKPRNRGCVPERKIDIDLLTEWKADGLTNVEIGRRFGVSDSAVAAAVRRYNVTGHKIPPTITARTDLASIPVSDQSAAIRLDLLHLLVLGIDQAKRMPVPREWRAMQDRQAFITSAIQQAAKLFGWDAKNSGSGGAINVNILAQAGNTKPVATLESSVLADSTTMPVLSAAKKDTPTLGKEPGAGHKELEQGAGAKHPFSDDEREEGEGEPLSGEGSTER